MTIEKFANHRLVDFARKLASGDPTPGGGTASALAGWFSASLLEMVCALSLRKKPDSAALIDTLPALPGIGTTLAALMDEDSAAYDAVMAAFRLPKGTEAEKAARSAAIQSASIEAARVPMRTARACAELMDRIEALSAEVLDAARSDWVVARELARTGLTGGLANVEINLPSIKNADVVDELRAGVTELRARLER